MRLHLSSAIQHWGKYTPNRIAIDGDQTITYYQLNSAASFVCEFVCSIPRHSGRIVVSLEDKALLAAAIVGCSRAGRTFVLIDPNRIIEYLAALEPFKGFDAILMDRHIDTQNQYKYLYLDQTVFTLQTKLSEQHDFGLLDEAAIIFTSGTTGGLKGVVRNNLSLLSEGILWIIELELTKKSKFLIARPFFWTGGFIFMYATLFIGGCIVTSNDNNEAKLFARAVVNPVDITFFVPNQIYSLLDQHSREAKKFSNLVLTMGAPISSEAKISFAQRFDCQVVESWGNSEGLGSITDTDDLLRAPNSIGHPFFCDALMIVDKTGQELSIGQTGYLAGKSDNQYDMYLHEQGKNATTDVARLIISEDVGYQSPEGDFYIMGRESEKMLVAGKEVFPAYIETLALGHPEIKDCAVTIVSQETTEEKLFLVVLSKGNPSKHKLLEWINEKMPHGITISDIVFTQHIPRNHGGKIDRSAVMNMTVV